LLAYYSWMRVHELAKLRMGDFRQLPDGNWVIRIQGKGRTINDIAAPPPLMDALQAYRLWHGLSPLPVAGDPAPALIPLRVRGEVLRPSAVYRIFKVIFGRAAARHPEYANELEAASSHWMRHTGITHAFDSGKIAPRFIQKQARHKDPKTSSRYDARNEQQLAAAFSVMGPPAAPERKGA
jgi:integrase